MEEIQTTYLPPWIDIWLAPNTNTRRNKISSINSFQSLKEVNTILYMVYIYLIEEKGPETGDNTVVLENKKDNISHVHIILAVQV